MNNGKNNKWVVEKVAWVLKAVKDSKLSSHFISWNMDDTASNWPRKGSQEDNTVGESKRKVHLMLCKYHFLYTKITAIIMISSNKSYSKEGYWDRQVYLIYLCTLHG